MYMVQNMYKYACCRHQAMIAGRELLKHLLHSIALRSCMHHWHASVLLIMLKLDTASTPCNSTL